MSRRQQTLDMMRDNEMITPLVTDKPGDEREATRCALYRGVHKVRVYHHRGGLQTAQQPTEKKAAREGHSKLGDVTYFIHYTDTKGRQRGQCV